MKIQSLSVVSLCFFLMVGLSWQVGAYDVVQLKKLKALGSCPSCDLSMANLKRANLTDTNLSGADLSRAILKGTQMCGAILCNTTMPDGSVVYSGC